MSLAGLVFAGFVLGAPSPLPEPLVDVSARVPDAVIDLRYATGENFLHRAVYPKGARCLLRESVVVRLVQAAETLRAQGLRLKLYDCYRPRAVQEAMWKIYPHRGYVADPKTGSHHNRGTAVDLTLVDAAGRGLEMPTPFDSFERAAHANDTSSSALAQQHRGELRAAMEAAGFKVNPMEWWHYDAPHAAAAPMADQSLTRQRE